MQRRKILQYIPIAFAITASPGQLLDIAHRARKVIFTPVSDREKLLVAIVDRILPATSTPSASEAGVPAFIQLALEELVAPIERDQFYKGLDHFGEQCTEQRGKRFEELDAASQDGHLTLLMEQQDSFCMQLKQMTMMAYYTSERGMTEALDYNPIPGSYQPCVKVTPDTKTEASYF